MWTPVIVGEDAEAYKRAVDDIVAAIPELPGRKPMWGTTLLLAYYGQATGRAETVSLARRFRDDAISQLESCAHSVALYHGLAGVGWLCAHVSKILGDYDPSAFDELDELLIRTLASDRLLDYDLINGVVGLAVYFLERFPSPRAEEGLMGVVGWLSRRAEPHGPQYRWHTPREVIHNPGWTVEEGYYNVGLAHGVAGIIACLANLLRVGIAPGEVSSLLRGAARWVLGTEEGDDFPSWIREDGTSGSEGRRPRRLSWCYGRLGVSAALHSAASALGDEELWRTTKRIVTNCTHDLDPQRLVVDSGLCHGAVGNAHVFNRLFQATRDDELRRAAVRWYVRALGMRDGTAGIAGYRTWTRQDGGAWNWAEDTSLLTGAPGVALSMLAAVSAVHPAWDRVLLLEQQG